MLPIILRGGSKNARIEISGASQPIRDTHAVHSYNGAERGVVVRWRPDIPDIEGQLFFGADALILASVAQGVMRQIHIFDFQIMQGHMNSVVFYLVGDGRVTRIDGESLVGWDIEEMQTGGSRRLTVRLNPSQDREFRLSVYTQTPLHSFPIEFSLLRIFPFAAT